jgi:K+-transporting ATPase ATPase C chain
MLNELRLSLRPAMVLLATFTLLLGLAYPLAVTGIAGVVMPDKAAGSLVVTDGKVIGSALIGQDFARADYFHSRPSAAGKGASVKELRAEGIGGAIPADLVTTSGSGLDPDISPAAAAVQVPRIAHARGLAASDVQAIVDARSSAPLFGDPHVSVLMLNRELDRISAEKAVKSTE